MENIDLKEFKRMKETLAKRAAKDIAEKIATIKVLLSEIKELAELTGINVKIDSELAYDMEQINALHPDWNSSSYHC
jgi:hypothetical protein